MIVLALIQSLLQHCVKGVRIRSYSGPYFPAFELNTPYPVSLRIQSECGKIWTRITQNTDTFHAVQDSNDIQVLIQEDKPQSSKFRFYSLRHNTA